MNYREYHLPATLEEAWQLNQKKSNHIIAGGMWLRLRRSAFGGAIDISGLGLDRIEETCDSFIIGAMVTLHDIERHNGMCALWGDAITEALSPIVGVQFRNCATVGGSISGRFGFSDVLTLFMALEADVRLYKGGDIPITEFAEKGCGNDILTHIIVRKSGVRTAYLTQRNAKTDFPVLACAVSDIDGRIFACVGARPMRAVRLECPADSTNSDIARLAADSVVFGSNARASAAYRRKICAVLVRRACEKLGRCE